METFAFIIILLIIVGYLYWKMSSSGMPDEELKDNKNNKGKKMTTKKRHIKFIVHKGPYILDEVLKNTSRLYLYEDNATNPSRTNRAHIGDEDNTASVITKHIRGNTMEAWYQDSGDEQAIEQIDESIAALVEKIRSKIYTRVIIPEDLGQDGELHIHAPKTFLYLLGLIFELAEKYDPSSLEEELGEWLRYQSSLAGKTKKRTAV